MKKSSIITTVIVVAVIVAVAGVLLNSRYHFLTGHPAATDKKELYYCPMHPHFTSDRPGDCKICGMSLVKKEAEEAPPMTHKHAEEATPAKTGFYISPEKQQLIGVKKGKAEVRRLVGRILTVGTVAYDPALFVAQQEYLQAVKSGRQIADSNLSYAIKGSETLVLTAKRKLLQMGMSEAEIERIVTSGKPEQSLYLPEGDKVWVYLVIYEYEAGVVKEGQKVRVEATAYPGEIFEGTIESIGPLLDPMTRSLKVRSLVNNPENKLKLDMFVNVKIEYDLGEKLAVPEEAVMRTGTRDIVFITDPNGFFESRNVTLGRNVQGYYEVLAGLSPNEEVVTSGNFLIDSESKLKAALEGTGHKHGQ